jgi:hypothetical protein
MEIEMSVFQVELNNIEQGLLDLDPSTHPLASSSPSSTPATYGVLGEPFGEAFPNSGDFSLQRQVFATGPNLTYRLLSDGETFTDCNYWKQFAYPQVEHEFAFIKVITDDGSVYSNIPEENTFGIGRTFGPLATTFSTPPTNGIDFIAEHGGPARYLQIKNVIGGGEVVTGELNGDATVIFTLDDGATQVFNMNDLAITQIRFKDDSGSGDVEVVGSVRSVCTS